MDISFELMRERASYFHLVVSRSFPVKLTLYLWNVNLSLHKTQTSSFKKKKIEITEEIIRQHYVDLKAEYNNKRRNKKYIYIFLLCCCSSARCCLLEGIKNSATRAKDLIFFFFVFLFWAFSLVKTQKTKQRSVLTWPGSSAHPPLYTHIPLKGYRGSPMELLKTKHKKSPPFSKRKNPI